MSKGADPDAPTIAPLADKMAMYTDPELSTMHQERSQVQRMHVSSLGTPNLMGFSSLPRPRHSLLWMRPMTPWSRPCMPAQLP